jgi:hypothetical protein
MLLIYGKRTARIKKYTDNQQACQGCKVFDHEVKVYRDYYHLFFIPVFPTGDKTAKIECKNCGKHLRTEALQKHYEKISNTPFYLFALPIILAGIFSIAAFVNLCYQKEKAIFVNNPKVGDVYSIRKEENNKTSYYFLRLVRISGDTVVAYHNNLIYNGFAYELNDDDFFVKNEEVYFTKIELQHMLEKTEINSVDRNYDDEKGFNRIK